MEKAKTLGILGGLGPMAGVYFYEKVTALTKASCDQEQGLPIRPTARITSSARAQPTPRRA